VVVTGTVKRPSNHLLMEVHMHAAAQLIGCSDCVCITGTSALLLLLPLATASRLTFGRCTVYCSWN
jgi:hypothetical protein